jgi:hypothetical protein
MVELERCRTPCGRATVFAALVLMTACSTVDKVKPQQPPGGTSPSGNELVSDQPEETPIDESEPVAEEQPIVEEDSVAEETGQLEAVANKTAPEEDKSLVIIDPGASDPTEHPRSLAEAARVERERRGEAPPADIVITDKNLSEYAIGHLTIADTSDEAADAIAQELSELEREMAEKEAYWRNGARQIRQEWRDAYDAIEELEAKVFDLRQQFYREDDGFYRDAEIKPAWDRAIDQLEEARREAEAKQEELAAFLEEGREAGALPGWLREGIELEPKPVAKQDAVAKPSEPVIYEPESSDPP